MDSGFGNNSKAFHNTVDFLARLSADRGRAFTLTNNESLKGTKHYKEGQVTHGFVSENGDIVLNVDSARAIETTTGHEITHVLEAAGAYSELSQAVRDYCISKEGLERYNARIKEAEEIYKGHKNTTPEAEVVADLIGEYVFSDADFVNNLSKSNRGLFERIYDEIKYLAKIATAGSKEARELERVKKLFAEAYRENVKGQENTAEGGGVKYSLVVKKTDGTEAIVDPAKISRSKILEYMDLSLKQKLDSNAYFPVRSNTPETIVATLEGAGVKISDKPIAMQVRKARQSQRDGDVHTSDGYVIRGHSMKPEQIMEVIDKLGDATEIVQETGLTKTVVIDGKKTKVPIADRFVAFVTAANGREYAAVLEFDSDIDPKYLVKDGHGDEYHTTITVFEPDLEVDGEPFDYFTFLTDKDTNYALKIIKESPQKETAIARHLPQFPKEELSNKRVPHEDPAVKQEDAVGEEITDAQNEQGLNTEQEARYSLSNDTAYEASEDMIAPVRQSISKEGAEPKQSGLTYWEDFLPQYDPLAEFDAPVREDIVAAGNSRVDTNRGFDYANAIDETEGGVISYERREETRDAFHRRANEKNYTVRERGKISCGYYSATNKTGRAGQTEKALQELGIPVIVHEGLEANVDGVTRAVLGDAASVAGDAVYVRNSIETDPIETAGHEAYHFWKRATTRTIYAETVTDNIDFASAEFIQFQKDIAESYFDEEVGIEDDGSDKLGEEIFAYITGLVHAGDSNNIVRPFLRDYDAVKTAWDTLVETQAQTSSVSQTKTDAELDELAPVGNANISSKAETPTAENAAGVFYDDIAPHKDNWRDAFDAITDKDAPSVKRNTAPAKEISTVQEKIQQKIKNTAAELEKNRQFTLVATVAVLAEKESNVENDVKEIKNDVKSIKEKPGKRWDAIVDKIVWAVLAAVIAFLLGRIGL